MRKLILKMDMSLEGFVSGLNGEADWIFETADAGSTLWGLETISQAGVHVMGRKTFEAMASYWPSSTEPYAASMNTIPKLVFTRGGKVDFSVITRREERADTKDARAYIEQQKLQRLSHEEAKKNFGSWQDAKVATDLAGELKRQKAQPGKPLIAYGGAGFARELIKHDLIDEYRLVVHPVALGKGLGIFDGLERTRKLKLISSSAFPAGATAHIFVPVR